LKEHRYRNALKPEFSPLSPGEVGARQVPPRKDAALVHRLKQLWRLKAPS
jgi:hypothetical protein